jgi:hypothetical protein
MSKFINFTNHPSNRWSAEQLAAAKEYGDVVDIPFPNILPTATEDHIAKLGDEYVKKILDLSPAAVMCQGEFTFSYYVISELLAKDINVLSACSERVVREVQETPDVMRKISEFKFVRFRKYVGK